MNTELSDEQIDLKCAEAMGWDRKTMSQTWADCEITLKNPDSVWCHHGKWVTFKPPSYTTSDTAARELRESLSEEEQPIFVSELIQISGEWETLKLMNSTPRQQALAYLKVKGLG